MKRDQISTAKRKPVNLSLDPEVVAAAREAGINLSQVSEAALRRATRAEQDRRWSEEHRGRMEAFGAWLDEHGMPFEDLRVF